MSNYQRRYVPGGSYFFTVVTEGSQGSQSHWGPMKLIFQSILTPLICEGGDTLAFMALDIDTWRNLESTFGTKVDEAFMRLTNGSSFFSA